MQGDISDGEAGSAADPARHRLVIACDRTGEEPV
jgi:hypothetical protein